MLAANSRCHRAPRHPSQHGRVPKERCRTELLIIDEADRLKTNGLEQLRDWFGRSDLGLILIGMPGFDRQLARYPQLYSRIGFAHQYKPLDTEDIPAVLAQYWQQLGPPDSDVDPDTEVVGTIVRITGWQLSPHRSTTSHSRTRLAVPPMAERPS